MKYTVNKLLEEIDNVEIDCDDEKLKTIQQFLTRCAMKRIVNNTSPQFVMLLQEALEFCKK